MSTITLNHEGTTSATHFFDLRFEQLQKDWAALKRVMSADNEVLRCAEWHAVDAVLNPPVEAELPNPVLPPAIPSHFPDDGPEVVKAQVQSKCHNRRMWIISFGEKDDARAFLWTNPDERRIHVGSKVWVKPNPNTGDGGSVLHGDYNKYGDRLR